MLTSKEVKVVSFGRCTCESVDGSIRLTVVSGAFEGKTAKKREKLVLQASTRLPRTATISPGPHKFPRDDFI